ncbi:MAG: hypothetical protein J3Q66DRAFT_276590 [Benniella sp.]|nr:MAG: hypothetical protein J3Q66DRAFT_276590 [Benniella sp.]
MPPPPPPSHVNANSQGGHETVPAAAAEPSTHIGTRSGTPSSSKQTVSAAEPSGPAQIFKATYSGVPVFEMICKGVAVMRRRSDSYLNATQILKVADFDKPQRTRILEREVQKGEHEKVQGGYGKYQGTWVPFERGIQLCQEYGVVSLLQPLLDYNTTQASPPLAPKHITAASNRPRKPREPRALGEAPTDTLTKQRMKPKTKKMKQKGGNAQILPKPMGGSLGGVEGGASVTGDEGEASMLATEDDDDDVDDDATTSRGPYADALLEYFVTDAEALPGVLKEPPADMDFNIVIDDEGHTALHWAAAMAKVDVVKILIQHGADTYRVNTDGQTALMRSVLFSNNYDQKSFPVLLEMLQKTIFTIDKDDQTVFHHVTITAGQRGKVHAARYYLECLLQKLAQHPSELASIINVQDSEGETALTIAARLKIGGKKVVAMLVDAGADSKIRTRSGKNAEDYLVETGDAATAAATVPGNQAPPLHPFAKSSVKNTAPGTETGGASRLQTMAKTQLPGGASVATTSQAVIPTVSNLFSRLTQSYERDIYEKDQDILEARNMLHGIQAEIREGQQTIQELKQRAVTLGQVEEQVRTLEEHIKQEIHTRQRLRLEELIGPTTTSSSSSSLSPTSSPSSKLQLLQTEVEQLREKLSRLQQQRKDRVNQIVQLKSSQGKRWYEYQRLIALCCNVSIDQVDDLLGPLLNSLGNKDEVENF